MKDGQWNVKDNQNVHCMCRKKAAHSQLYSSLNMKALHNGDVGSYDNILQEAAPLEPRESRINQSRLM